MFCSINLSYFSYIQISPKLVFVNYAYLSIGEIPLFCFSIFLVISFPESNVIPKICGIISVLGIILEPAQLIVICIISFPLPNTHTSKLHTIPLFLEKGVRLKKLWCCVGGE